MANTCLNCKRTLGLLSGEYKIYPDSPYFLCDKCFSPFMSAANRIRTLQDVNKLNIAYFDAIEDVQNSELDEKSIILYELKQSYLSRFSDSHRAELDLAKLEQKKKEEKEEENRKKEEENRKKEEEIRKTEYIDKHYDEISKSFLLTTGNDFSGYKIIEYLGIVSEGVVQGTGFLSEFSADLNDFFGTESNTFAKKIKLCRDSALQRAKDTAIRLGANALVSIDFETTTFRNNMIGIMVAGTAVRIEKQKDILAHPFESDSSSSSSIRRRRGASLPTEPNL